MTTADSRRLTTSVSTTIGGGGRIRTFEGVSRQIYSLLPLAAWVPLPGKNEPRILVATPRSVNGIGATFATVFAGLIQVGVPPDRPLFYMCRTPEPGARCPRKPVPRIRV